MIKQGKPQVFFSMGKRTLFSTMVLAGTSILPSCSQVELKDEKPNILWIILDDTGIDFSAYGNKLINTPVFDSLAENGVLFTNMHVTAPVCSPARSAMITGQYQTSNGTHQHRSSRGEVLIFTDPDKPLVPELFKKAGYFTGNVGYDYGAKTDYNFVWNPEMYDVMHRINEDEWKSPWSGRAEGQPFFIQIQLQGGKNRGVTDRYPVDLSLITPAPYYPSDSLFLSDQSSYHSSTLHADKLLGDIMEQLRNEGLTDNTIVMVLGDNGQDNYRDKQWLYQGGTLVPFVVSGPEKYVKNLGEARTDMAIHIDMAPTSLAIAGISIPSYLEGVNLFSENYKEREFIVTARDRCDWTQDRIRAVVTKEFKYIRNYFPDQPYMQSNYRDEWPMVLRAKQMYAARLLDSVQTIFFLPKRPAEEFYILGDDSFEINNQIDNPEFKDQIDQMRFFLDDWIIETGDHGEKPESAESYREALKHVNTGVNISFPIQAGPTLFQAVKDVGAFGVIARNITQKPLDVDIMLLPSRNFSNFNKIQSMKIQPGETSRVDFREPFITYAEEDSIVVRISTYYAFNEISGHYYTWEYVVKPSVALPVPESTKWADGYLGDWAEGLPYAFGPGDKVKFGVSWSAQFVHFAAEVLDTNVVAEAGKDPWQQDGIEVRIDARKEPLRTSGIGLQDFADHLLLAMSPSSPGQPALFYKPAYALRLFKPNFFERDLRYTCRTTPTGYIMEAAIPVEYFNELQDGDWQGFRLNVIVHDNNTTGNRQFLWQPKWGSTNDFSGTGLFSKK